MRDLPQPLLDELNAASILHLILLGEFDFVEGMQRFWAGPEGHALSWNGNTYNSISDLGQIDKVSEAQGLTDSRTTVSLRVNSDSVDVVGGADSRGRAANLYILFINPDPLQVIGSMKFAKTMGALRVSASISREGDRKIINEKVDLELMDETAILSRSHICRLTYEQGLRIDPNDHGLEYVSDPTMANIPGGLNDHRPVPPHWPPGVPWPGPLGPNYGLT